MVTIPSSLVGKEVISFCEMTQCHSVSLLDRQKMKSCKKKKGVTG